MSMTALVTIAGTAIPDPSAYEGNTATIVNNGRNVRGEMVGGVIRHNVAKVTMKWKFISAANWATILKLFNPDYSGSFVNSVTFFNQDVNGYETTDMYVSDRKASIFLRNADGTIRGYVDAQLSLIEV